MPHTGGVSAVINATVTPVSGVSANAFTLLAENRGRNYFMIWNPTAVVLYVKLGASASSADYTFPIAAGAGYESGAACYTGLITGRLASSTGTIQVTEGA